MATNFDHAFNNLKKTSRQLPSWAHGLRESAFAEFTNRGYPTRKDEEWKYTNVKPLAGIEFAWLEAPATKHFDAAPYLLSGAAHLIMVNGHQVSMPKLPAGLSVKPITDAATDNPAVADALRQSFEPDNVFSYLNQAFLHSGWLIEVAKNAVIEQPLQLVFAHTHESSPYAVFPKIILSLAEGSSLTLIETHVGESEAEYLNDTAATVVVNPNAHLRHMRIQNDSRTAYHIGITKAQLARDSRYENFMLTTGSKLSRQDLTVTIAGEGAEASVDGLYLCRELQHHDHHTAIDHTVPHARSHQLYKGLLADQSRAVFNGKIFVRRNAQGTQAFQLNNNMLLSKTAEIDTKPQLEIDADDVKCSHGATIGRLSQDELFYLLSRAIPRRVAEKLLCQAFASDVLSRISAAPLRNHLNHYIGEFLEQTLA